TCRKRCRKGSRSGRKSSANRRSIAFLISFCAHAPGAEAHSVFWENSSMTPLQSTAGPAPEPQLSLASRLGYLRHHGLRWVILAVVLVALALLIVHPLAWI